MIKVQHLTVKYEKKIALEDISFDVKEGDYLAIVGQNGSGKSTLMKTLLGLKSASGGTISMGSFEKIGYLPQLDESLDNFPARVEEIVKIGLLNQVSFPYFYGKKEKERVNEVLEELKIYDLKKKYFGALSGGQKQRVLLARALIASRDILFLDEPTTGLDPIATKEFYDCLDELSLQGLTIVMITHDVQTAVNCAKSILHVNRKRLFFGAKEDYVQTEFYRLLSGVHIHD